MRNLYLQTDTSGNRIYVNFNIDFEICITVKNRIQTNQRLFPARPDNKEKILFAGKKSPLAAYDVL
jgi:hypothetical protein